MGLSAGEQLKEAREKRGLTIEQAAKLTHVRAYYLEALENNQRDRLPSAVQARGFLRLYAGVVGLPSEPLLAAWDGKVLPETPLSAPTEPAKAESHASDEIGPAAENQNLIEENEVREAASERIVEELSQSNAPDTAEFAADNADQGSSQAIFQEIGDTLRKQREALGLSRAEVERYTRLRQHYIQALEEGRMEGMPSPVQGRGMLSNYAAFLNLNEEKLLLRFAEGLQVRRVERIPKPEPQGLFNNKKRPARQATAWKRLITPDLVFGITLAAIILFFVMWSAARISSLRTAEAEPTTPAIAEIILTTPSPAAGTADAPQPGEGPDATAATLVSGETSGEEGPVGSKEGLEQAPLPVDGELPVVEEVPTLALLPAGDGSPTQTPTLPPSGSQPLQVYIVARQRAWLQVIADGKVEFLGRTIPGNAYAFSGNKRIEMLTGSAGALQVFFNQNDLGTLGNVGQVASLVFAEEGMMTPTAAFTATPTITPPSTLTPIPSATPMASATITPFVP